MNIQNSRFCKMYKLNIHIKIQVKTKILDTFLYRNAIFQTLREVSWNIVRTSDGMNL